MSGITYPTLTHVPPIRPPSIIMALMPYLALAVRAAPSPPLPLPMTSNSVSLEIGAMAKCVAEKCLDKVLRRPLVDILVKELTGRRTRTEKDCMGKPSFNKGLLAG